MNENQLIAALKGRVRDPKRSEIAPPPASPELIKATEARLGFPLPPLLRRLYAEVADGGFGPGSGLLPLAAPKSAHKESLSSSYVDAISGESPDGLHWPEKLLPLWDWGCAMWSCLDARSDAGPIVTSNEGALTVTPFTLHTWLEAWLKGVDLNAELFEDSGITRQGINPFTKQPMTFKGAPRAKGTPIAAW
jgi:SMI1 / KNR4 family (SUKH-1)